MKQHDYRCDICKKKQTRETMFSKRIQFIQARRGGSLVKSRVVTWLCRPCMEADPDWSREMHTASPGMRGNQVGTAS